MQGKSAQTERRHGKPALRLLRSTGLTMAVVSMVFALAGCYESPDATMYEAGDYKGQDDPLLEDLRTEEVQQTLADRIRTGQSDR